MITIDGLIQYANDKIRDMERQYNKCDAGDPPRFPMSVFYIGNNENTNHRHISRNIYEVWPQFEKTINFYKVTLKGNTGLNYSKIGDEDTNSKLDLKEELDELFKESSGFKEFGNLCAYYIINTSDFSSYSDYEKSKKTIRKLNEEIVHESRTMTIILLDESTNSYETARDIKDDLLHWFDDSNTLSNSVVVLSNKLSNHSFVSPDNRGKIVASLLLLSNTYNNGKSLFENNILTVRYAREEKQNKKIAQILVRKILESVAGYMDKEHATVEGQENELYNRLNLSHYGTFKLLDEYIDSLSFIRIDNELLSIFPTIEKNISKEYIYKSIANFNRETMGGFSAYLNSLVAKVQNVIQNNLDVQMELKSRCSRYLAEAYTIDELIFMYKNIDSIKKIYFQSIRTPGYDGEIGNTVGNIIKCLIGKETKVVDIFFDTIVKLGKDAEDCVETLAKLQGELRRVPTIYDTSLNEYYGRIADDYIAANSQSIMSLVRVRSIQELENEIKRIIKDIINKYTIFREPFVNELDKRLKDSQDPKEAREYIYTKLTQDIKQYLPTIVHMDKIVSAISLMTNSPLCDYLKRQEGLDEKSSCIYFNTGYDRAAESIEICVVGRNNLMKDTE